MEKILFDFSYYQGYGIFHGGGEYGNVVLKELISRNNTDTNGVFFYGSKIINLDILKLVQEKGWGIHPIQDLRNIPSIVKRYGYTTVYSPLPYSTIWKKVALSEKVRFMGTFHGLRSVETSLFDESEKNFYDSFEVQDSEYIYNVDGRMREVAVERYGIALRAFTNRQIIVVSEHSKYAMRYYYPDISPNEITVLYSPPKQLSHSINDMDEQIFLDRIGIEKQNYGLMVSAGIYYKNPIRVLLAYDRLFSANYVEIPSTYKVVVTGIKNKEVILNKLSNHDRFILLEYVEDNELEILYKNAQLFLYPSLNEGFGYPPLEAMKYGTICACSVNTSIPEICRDMVLYFNPLLIDEICIRILQSFSEKIRDEKQKEIRKELPIVQKKQKEDLIKLVDIMLGV